MSTENLEKTRLLPPLKAWAKREQDPSISEKCRADIMARYLRKPIRCFLQYDGFFVEPGDSFIVPDDEGDSFWSSIVFDPRTSGDDMIVRLQIVPSAQKVDVLRQISKLKALIEESDWDHVAEEVSGARKGNRKQLHGVVGKPTTKER